MKKAMALLSAFIFCFSGCLTVRAAEKAPAAGNTIPSAAAYLEDRLKEYDNVRYVYKDFVDGANYFTQKAWIGSNYADIPEMRENAAGYSGISGIAAELNLGNHTWGGYMFINGILPTGEINPVNDFGEHNAGLDLTGAEKLIFYARGENGGERVEFFMGGLGYDGFTVSRYADSTETVSTGYVTLSKEWKRYEIPLAGMDLSRIACGFGWVTNDRNNPGKKAVRFSMDDIHYVFSKSSVEPMFLQSYASEKPGTDASIINNFAYLYDNAAAVMALSYAGKHVRARQIADAIVYALHNDRFFTDGRLRNAYMSGNPQSYPGWFSSRGKEFAELPGFYDISDKAWYEDYYAVSTSTGNLAWAILALCEVYENAPERKVYLSSAREIGDFILTLKDDRGGFTGGYEGWEGGQTKVTYKSTEHNIDLISAYGKLNKLTGETKYAEASAHARAFVLSMYDKDEGCFYTGTTPDGVTVNRDVLPLDCNTWALMTLGKEFKEQAKVLTFVEEHMAMGGGYNFNTVLDGVWMEGTAQVALAYMLVGDTKQYDKILTFLNGCRLPDGSITAADRDGLTTGFLVSGTDIPWNYYKRGHVGATAWLAFAQLGRNPFD